MVDESVGKVLLELVKRHGEDMRSPLDIKKVTRAMLELANAKLFVDQQPLIDIDAFYANSEKGMSAFAAATQIGLEAEMSDVDVLKTDPQIQKAVKLQMDYYISQIRQYQILQRRPKHEWASFLNTSGQRRLLPGKPLTDVQFVKMLFNMLFLSLERTMISSDDSEDLTLRYEGTKYGEYYTIDQYYDDDEDAEQSPSTSAIGVRLNADGTPKRPRKRRGKLTVQAEATVSMDMDQFNQRFHANRGAWISQLESQVNTLVPAPNMVKYWPEVKVLIVQMLKRMRSDQEYSEEDECHLFTMCETAVAAAATTTTTEDPDVLFFKVLFGVPPKAERERRGSLNAKSKKPEPAAAVPLFSLEAFRKIKGVLITMALGVAAVTALSIWKDSFIVKELTKHNDKLATELDKATEILSKLDTQSGDVKNAMDTLNSKVAESFDKLIWMLGNSTKMDKSKEFQNVIVNSAISGDPLNAVEAMTAVHQNATTINDYYKTLRTYGASYHIYEYTIKNPTERLTDTKVKDLLKDWYKNARNNDVYFPNLPLYGTITDVLFNNTVPDQSDGKKAAIEAAEKYAQTLKDARATLVTHNAVSGTESSAEVLKLTEKAVAALKQEVEDSIRGFQDRFTNFSDNIKEANYTVHTMANIAQQQRKHLLEKVKPSINGMTFIANYALTSIFEALGLSEGYADADTIRMLVEMIPPSIMQQGNLMLDLPKTLLSNLMRKQTGASKLLLGVSIASLATEYLGIQESTQVLSVMQSIFTIGSFMLPIVSAVTANLIPDVAPAVKAEKRRKEITEVYNIITPNSDANTQNPNLTKMVVTQAETRIKNIDILKIIYELSWQEPSLTKIEANKEYILQKGNETIMFTEEMLQQANADIYIYAVIYEHGHKLFTPKIDTENDYTYPKMIEHFLAAEIKHTDAARFFDGEVSRLNAAKENAKNDCTIIKDLLAVEYNYWNKYPKEEAVLANPTNTRSQWEKFLAAASLRTTKAGQWAQFGASTMAVIATYIPFVGAISNHGVTSSEFSSIMLNSLTLTAVALTIPTMQYLAHKYDPKKYPSPLSPMSEIEKRKVGYFGKVLIGLGARRAHVQQVFDVYSVIRPYYLIPYAMYGLSFMVPASFPNIRILSYITATQRALNDDIVKLTNEIPIVDWVRSTASNVIGFQDVRSFVVTLKQNQTTMITALDDALKKINTINDKVRPGSFKYEHVDVYKHVTVFISNLGDAVQRYAVEFL